MPRKHDKSWIRCCRDYMGLLGIQYSSPKECFAIFCTNSYRSVVFPSVHSCSIAFLPQKTSTVSPFQRDSPKTQEHGWCQNHIYVFHIPLPLPFSGSTFCRIFIYLFYCFLPYLSAFTMALNLNQVFYRVGWKPPKSMTNLPLSSRPQHPWCSYQLNSSLWKKKLHLASGIRCFLYQFGPARLTVPLSP